jgi:hypothetical protein
MNILVSGRLGSKVYCSGDLIRLGAGEEVEDSSWDRRGEDFTAPEGGCWVKVLGLGSPSNLARYLVLTDEEKDILVKARML